MEIPKNIYSSLKAQGYSDKEIEAEAKKRGYSMPKGFLADAWSDVGETLGGVAKSLYSRGENITNIAQSSDNPLGKVFQVGGQIAGGIGDTIGNAILGAGKVALPQSAETAIGTTFKGAVQSAPVQDAMAKYQKFKSEYPDVAKYLESTGNYLDLFTTMAPGAIKKGITRAVDKAVDAVVPQSKTISNVAKKLSESAQVARDESAARMIFSKNRKESILGGERANTLAVKSDPNAIGGSFGRVKANLTENATIKRIVERTRTAVSGKKAVDAVQSLQQNIDTLEKQRKALTNSTQVSKAMVSPKDVSARLKEITLETAGKYPDLDVGAANRTMNYMVEKFMDIYNKTSDGKRVYSGTVAGFSNAIEEWKRVVRKEMSSAFDPNTRGGKLQGELVDEMRKTLDGMVDEALVKGGAVKNPGEYLQLGQDMYYSINVQDILSKNAQAGVNKSLMKAMQDYAGFKGILAISGASAVIAMTVSAGPQFTKYIFALLAAGGAYKVGKDFITGPVLKENLSKMLDAIATNAAKETDEATKQMLMQDYAAIGALLNTYLKAEAEANGTTTEE